MVGAALHIAAHAFGKITLFFAAGAIYTASHKTEVSELDGVGRRMPWTLAAFAIASLSMIGLPPTAGMVSKWYIVTGAVQTQHWVALAVIVASTLLNAGYFLPIVYRAFLRDPSTGEPAHGEAPWTMVVALVATAALTVLMFFFADVPIALARGLLGGNDRGNDTGSLDPKPSASFGDSSWSCWRSPCLPSSSFQHEAHFAVERLFGF